MEFRIDFAARKAIGLLTAVMALTSLFMCLTVAEGAGKESRRLHGAAA